MIKLNATITAVGGYIPEYVLTNKILETMVETNDEWIVSRTGIKERRHIKKGDGNTTAIAPVQIAILGANTNLVFSDIQIIA